MTCTTQRPRGGRSRSPTTTSRCRLPSTCAATVSRAARSGIVCTTRRSSCTEPGCAELVQPADVGVAGGTDHYPGTTRRSPANRHPPTQPTAPNLIVVSGLARAGGRSRPKRSAAVFQGGVHLGRNNDAVGRMFFRIMKARRCIVRDIFAQTLLVVLVPLFGGC
jgi:hypothetical protein